MLRKVDNRRILDSTKSFSLEQSSLEMATGRSPRSRHYSHLTILSMLLVILMVRRLYIGLETIVRNSTTTKKTNDAAQGEPSQFQFGSTLWSNLQQSICPRMTPKVEVGSTLFYLAAREIRSFSRPYDKYSDKQKEHSFRSRPQDFNSSFVSTFYHGLFVDPLQSLVPISNSRNKMQRLVYIPIWKCANDQIRYYLQTTFPFTTVMPSNNNKETTSSSTLFSRECWFSVIRDPIDHFLSAYNEIEHRWKNPTYDITENVQTSNSSIQLHATEENGKSALSYIMWKKQQAKLPLPYMNETLGSKERFVQFVMDVLTPPINKSTTKNETGNDRMLHWMYRHLASMSRVLSAISTPEYPPKNLKVHILSRNLSQTFPKFLQTSCDIQVGKSQSMPHDAGHDTPTHNDMRMPLKGQHESSNDVHGTYQSAKNVWHDEGDISRALCILHVMDYACWSQIVSLSIPKVCQEVYSSSHFLEHLVENL